MAKSKMQAVRRQFAKRALTAFGVVACAGLASTAGSVRAAVAAADAHAPAVADAPKTWKKAAPAAPVKPIDINSASRVQLKTLPGIGDAEADKIVAARPYLSKVHLVTEAGLPIGVFQSIRHRIIAVQPPKQKPKQGRASTPAPAPDRKG